jgi:hypothetical protein
MAQVARPSASSPKAAAWKLRIRAMRVGQNVGIDRDQPPRFPYAGSRTLSHEASP